jgi:hypothetical protein
MVRQMVLSLRVRHLLSRDSGPGLEAADERHRHMFGMMRRKPPIVPARYSAIDTNNLEVLLTARFHLLSMNLQL